MNFNNPVQQEKIEQDLIDPNQFILIFRRQLKKQAIQNISILFIVIPGFFLGVRYFI